ncbi:hypothetical protein BDQ12DRAFT_274734 [Crucibulum laeve]|uniref:Mid2 domain-containing protein n=1 Tax=Crucibulum laeve TaxID=68775 RepID=A0A5C3MAK4_9AGAR|nr:hypothetical protein BDQ12DRAFT_274734 [Crucibulum laeve]
MLWNIFVLAISALTLQELVPGAFGQTSDAICLPYYSWAFTSQKKSPCEVASSLIAVCNGGPFNVDALPDQSHYLGPTLAAANPCLCNTVTYSLMSACGACQGRTFLSWSVWSANCNSVTDGSYPQQLPTGLLVPGWAYDDVQGGDNFDQSLARQNANATESSVIPPPPSSTPTHSSSTSSSTSNPATSKSTAHPSSSKSASSAASSVLASTSSQSATQAASSGSSTPDSAPSVSHSNAVGGGAVGGLLGGLVLIGGLVYWLLRRQRHSARNQVVPSEPNISPPQTSDMSQYIANTVPVGHLESSNNSAVGSRAMYTDSSVSGSAHSVRYQHV